MTHAIVPSDSAPAAVGSSAPEAGTVRGMRPGLVTLRLVQRRRWETDKPPLNIHDIEVAVTDAAPVTASLSAGDETAVGANAAPLASDFRTG